MWRSAALAVAVVFLLVPAATRAGQCLDPAGHVNQMSGFRNSSTAPPDPVSVPADVSVATIVVAPLAAPPVVEPSASVDDRLPSGPPPLALRTLRAPPSRWNV